MSAPGTPEASKLAPIVIDLGKQKKKQVKRLAKGEGRLMEDVEAAVTELRSAGQLSGDVVPLVVVVREKRRNRSFLRL